MLVTGHNEIVVNLVANHEHPVVQADSRQATELLRSPDAPNGIVRATNDNRRGVGISSLSLEIVEVDFIVCAIELERVLDNLSPVLPDGHLKRVIHGRLNDHAVSRRREGPNGGVDGGNDAWRQRQPLAPWRPIVATALPANAGLVIGIGRFGVARHDAIDKLVEGLLDLRRNLELHVGNRKWDNPIRQSPTRHGNHFVPLGGTLSDSVGPRLEIECDGHGITSKRIGLIGARLGALLSGCLYLEGPCADKAPRLSGQAPPVEGFRRQGHAVGTAHQARPAKGATCQALDGGGSNGCDRAKAHEASPNNNDILVWNERQVGRLLRDSGANDDRGDSLIEKCLRADTALWQPLVALQVVAQHLACRRAMQQQRNE